MGHAVKGGSVPRIYENSQLFCSIQDLTWEDALVVPHGMSGDSMGLSEIDPPTQGQKEG